MKPHKRSVPTGGSELGLPTQEDQEGVDITEDNPAARADDPGQLGHCSAYIGKVDEGQGPDGSIDRGTLQRKGCEIALTKLSLRTLSAGLGQHLSGSVDTDDAMTSFGQVHTIAPGPAGCIEDDRRRKGVARRSLDQSNRQTMEYVGRDRPTFKE